MSKKYLLSFDNIEDSFPDEDLIIGGTYDTLINAQWLHDFAKNIEEVLIDKLIKHLEKDAFEEIPYDLEDFNPADYSGHNFDDAFNMGMQTGRVIYTRNLIEKLILKELP